MENTFNLIIKKIIKIENNIFSSNYDANDNVDLINKILFSDLIVKNNKSYSYKNKFIFLSENFNSKFLKYKINSILITFSRIQQIYNTLNNLITNAFDQYKSTFSINPTTQFTSRKIQISVQLKDTNGAPLLNVPVTPDFADKIASKINAIVTFGTVEKFVYDNAGNFISNIVSTDGGNGTIKISFDNKVISDLIVPQDITIDPTIQERVLNYTFIYSPGVSAGGGSDGDTFGAPIRDEADISRGV